jgi:hypothetical protein
MARAQLGSVRMDTAAVVIIPLHNPGDVELYGSLADAVAGSVPLHRWLDAGHIAADLEPVAVRSKTLAIDGREYLVCTRKVRSF